MDTRYILFFSSNNVCHIFKTSVTFKKMFITFLKHCKTTCTLIQHKSANSLTNIIQITHNSGNLKNGFSSGQLLAIMKSINQIFALFKFWIPTVLIFCNWFLYSKGLYSDPYCTSFFLSRGCFCCSR